MTNIKYYTQYLLIRFFIGIIKLFPESWRYKFGELIGSLGYHLIKKRRMIAHANIKLAFPHMSEEEVATLAKKNYKILTKSYLSTLWLPEFIFDEKKVVIENKEILEKAAKKGRGVILATLHMGTFEAALSLAKDYKFASVAKAQRNPYIDKYITKNREKLGVHIIKKSKRAPREIVNIVKEKGVLALMGDHRDKGAKVNFFGVDTISPTGPVYFALRQDIPLVFGYCTLDDKNINHVRFLEEIEFVRSDNMKNDVQVNTQLLINKMEKVITEHPEQWMWFHDRWKLWKKIRDK